MDIIDFQESTFEAAKNHVLSKGLKSLNRDDGDFFFEILMSGCPYLEEKVNLLVSAGVDDNAHTTHYSGLTALSRVVKGGKEPRGLIDLLLANGADIEAPSEHGLTPLHCAIILQNLELVKYLISKGANPNSVDDDRSSCLMLALSSNGEFARNRYYYQFNDISWCIKKLFSIEILDELVLSGSKLDYDGGLFGSVLDVAIKTGEIQIIDWLLRQGIKPTDTVSSGSSETLLMSACECGPLSFINHLLQLGATVDDVDQAGKTALFYTSEPEVAKALLDAGANLTHLDNKGCSLFQEDYFSERIFRKFGRQFVRSGGNINAKTANGQNILHGLVNNYGNFAAIKLAIVLGCDVNSQDQNGTTPLMLADVEYWPALLAAGARINDVDANGDHALNLQLSRDLLEFGANINWANKRGQTPLMLAAKKGDIPLVQALLKAGACVDAIDQEGKFATDYASVKALTSLVKVGAPINPESASALVTAIAGGNASLSLELLKTGLKARLSGVQVKYNFLVLENIAQENIDFFRAGIFGNGDEAEKLLAKIVAATDHILEVAKAQPVCGDEDLPLVLRPGKWPRKAEAPTPHIKVVVPLNDARIPLFNPPEGFNQRMSALHDRIMLDLSGQINCDKKYYIKEIKSRILRICREHALHKSGTSRYWKLWNFKSRNSYDIGDLFICSDEVVLRFWNVCHDIYDDLLSSDNARLITKSKFDLALYRLKGDAFGGIKQGHDFSIHCLAYFDAIELAPVMARALGCVPAQTWFRRFTNTAISGLLTCAFSDVLSDRSDAQQALRWLSGQGHKDQIERSAKSYGAEAHAAALIFLDRSDESDFLPKKLPKLPAYFVASAHPAPILKGTDKALPAHAVETLGRMMLASTCYLQTPALIQVIDACDPQSLADFAFSAYISYLNNGARKKEGIGFLHALGYVGDARASASLIETFKNARFYPSTVAAIEVLGALGSNAAISGLLKIMRSGHYDKPKAYAQEVLEGVAESRGLTTEQIEDLAIPDLGLNADGQMHMDFGPRQFTASITANLDIILTDNLGRLIKTLPDVAKSDDARLANLATAQWNAFKAGKKGVSTDQLRRFEQTMVEGRRWDGSTFKEVVAVHPLLSKMVRNLVWAVAGENLKDLQSFRIDTEGRYVIASGEEIALPDNASIILPHPLLLDSELPIWLEVFTREKLTQPILQLARKWFVEGAQTDELLDDKADTKVPLGALKGLKTKGWEFEIGDAGMVWSVHKSVAGASASIDPEPGWFLSGYDGDGYNGSQTVKLSVSGSDPIAYSELVREFLSLPIVEDK